MYELREALAQIREIRARMASSQVYGGYRAVPTAVSALLALTATFVQGGWVTRDDIYAYVLVWGICALASMAVAGATMVWHCLDSTSPLTRARTLQAVGRLGVPLLAGAMVTVVLLGAAPDFGWALPGLWQVFFALGLFASAGLLPRAILAVAGFYLVAGCIALSLGPRALSPGTMGISFVAGQSAAALILARHRGERS